LPMISLMGDLWISRVSSCTYGGSNFSISAFTSAFAGPAGAQAETRKANATAPIPAKIDFIGEPKTRFLSFVYLFF
jgi:hypothetical protein